MSPFGDDRYSPDPSPDAPRAAITVAEKMAQSILLRHNVSTIPIPVESLAEAESLTIVPVTDPNGPDGELRAEAKLLMVNMHGRAPSRVRFTVAHELGHWCLGHHKQRPDDALLTALLDHRLHDELDPLRSGQDLVEIEANAFAAALLMPTHAMRAVAGTRGFNAHREAQRFAVSTEAFFYRLTHLRLLD